MRLYACQFDIAWEDKPANHAKVRALVERASPAPGSLLLLPEMFATGFTMNIAAAAEDLAPNTAQFLADLARAHNLYLLAGLVSRAPSGLGRNQAVLFSPQGTELLRYQKIHPFSFSGEDRFYEPGAHPVTFPWAGLIVAPFVCYDLRFPEVFRAAALGGAQVLAVIANWPASRELHWLTLLAARAIENQAYVVGVNRTGRDPNVAYAGRSLIIDPRGQVLADAADRETLIHADLDPQLLADYRRTFPALKDARYRP